MRASVMLSIMLLASSLLWLSTYFYTQRRNELCEKGPRKPEEQSAPINAPVLATKWERRDSVTGNLTFCPPETTSGAFYQRVLRNKEFVLTNDFRFWIPKVWQQYLLVWDEHWWCDKLEPDTTPYVPPASKWSVHSKDIVYGVVSGHNVMWSRALAVRDTWMMRFPNSYLFDQDGHPTFPVVGLKEAGMVRSGVGATFMWALKWMYEQHPEGKWFHVVGCDNWIDAEETMRMLEAFDPSKDHFLVNEFYWDKEWPWEKPHIPRENLLRMMDYYTNKAGFRGQMGWSTGGVGYWLSNSVVRAYANELAHFETMFPGGQFSGAPDVDTCYLLLWLGFRPTNVNFGDAKRSRASARALETVAHNDGDRPGPGLVLTHFTTPFRMVSLDQYQLHRRADRLFRAADMEGLKLFLHEMIDERSEMLRRHLKDVRFLVEEKTGGAAHVWDDIPPMHGKDFNLSRAVEVWNDTECALNQRWHMIKKFRRTLGPARGSISLTSALQKELTYSRLEARLKLQHEFALKSLENRKDGKASVEKAREDLLVNYQLELSRLQHSVLGIAPATIDPSRKGIQLQKDICEMSWKQDGNFSCPPGTLMSIHEARYHRLSRDRCVGERPGSNEPCGGKDYTAKAKSLVAGGAFSFHQGPSGDFGEDPCPYISKEVTIKYSCN